MSDEPMSAAERMRRYRARMAGLDVPRLRSGPKRDRYREVLDLIERLQSALDRASKADLSRLAGKGWLIHESQVVDPHRDPGGDAEWFVAVSVYRPEDEGEA